MAEDKIRFAPRFEIDSVDIEGVFDKLIEAVSIARSVEESVKNITDGGVDEELGGYINHVFRTPLNVVTLIGDELSELEDGDLAGAREVIEESFKMSWACRPFAQKAGEGAPYPVLDFQDNSAAVLRKLRDYIDAGDNFESLSVKVEELESSYDKLYAKWKEVVKDLGIEFDIIQHG